MNDMVNPEAERTVLGAVLVDNAAMPGAANRLIPEWFGLPANAAIFRAMLSLFDRSDPIDLVTLRTELGDRLESVGGSAYLAGLVDGLPRITSVSTWADIVLERAKRRAARQLGRALQAAAEDEGQETAALIDAHQAAVSRLMEAGNVGVRTLAQVLPETMRDLEAFAEAPDGLTGLATGLHDFDRLSGGLRRGTLTIIGGLPGRGKSVLCKQIAVNAARHGARVLFLGMEMEPRDIASRMLLAEAEVDKWDLRVCPESTWPKVVKAHDRLTDLPILFDPRETPTLGQIRATAKQIKASKGLDLLIVDYLQRCQLDARLEMWQAIGEVAKGLKNLSRSLAIPVIAACQLRADAENREPNMSDFAGARQVIQAEADIITLLHPEEGDKWRDSELPLFRLIVPKHRSGATSTGLRLTFHKSTSRFLTMADQVETRDWRGEI